MLPCWNLQIGGNYNQTSSFNVKGQVTQGADVASESRFNYQYKIQPRQWLVQGKLLYRYEDIYHPYLLLGLGGAINTSYGFQTSVPPTLTYTQQFQNATKHSFSFRVGLGLDVDLYPNVRIGAGYNFANFGKANLGNASIQGVPVNRTLSQDSIGVNEVLAQVTFFN